MYRKVVCNTRPRLLGRTGTSRGKYAINEHRQANLLWRELKSKKNCHAIVYLGLLKGVDFQRSVSQGSPVPERYASTVPAPNELYHFTSDCVAIVKLPIASLEN